MYRINTMTQALTVKGSLVHNNTNLRSAIHCALNVWLTNDWQNPNWWFNMIDIPMHATSLLLMLHQNVSDFEVEKINKISYRAAWWLPKHTNTGTNLLDMIRSQLYRSLATNNVTGLVQGFARIWKDVAILPLGGQGIQNDWSYHFHGYQLLVGSYGIIWVQSVLLSVLCSIDTRYQPDQQHLLVFGQFLTKGSAWMIVENKWDWNVVGRSISRPFTSVSIVDMNPDWVRLLARVIQDNQTKTELMNFADRLANLPNAPQLIGNKHFYTSDYQVHRRANWTCAIKMQSVRTEGSECTNGENSKDEHGGQGVLNLYLRDTYDYDFIFPLLDWQAINGITVEHGIPLQPCQSGHFAVKKLAFVGGVSDGQYGLAMMDTASHNLTAKRSWHFYDDAVVALATNLTLTTPTSAWTTLASRLLPTGQITIGFFNSSIITLTDGNYSFPYSQNQTSNVQWIHVGGSNIGYLLQLQQKYDSIGVRVGIANGNYDTINIYNYSVSARMLTLWIDHGHGPYTLDYYYMIVPNVSLESMPSLIKQYDEEQVFACTSTNNEFHGSMWPKLRRASFVLWADVSTTFSCKSASFEVTIEVNAAGAYLFSESDVDFTLTASHPIRVQDTLKVTVDRVGHGDGCSASSSTTTVIVTLPSSPEFLGASTHTTCKK